MNTTIDVAKQTVGQLLGSGKVRPFTIPEYQRPYAWEEEQTETLFEDLWSFALEKGGSKRDDASYFLGSIVSFDNNENKEQEIIDGQQRITTLFLLLRAIYTNLVQVDEKERTAEAKNFIKQIEPAIWRTNKLTGEVNYDEILLTSRAVDDSNNSILTNILATGIADENNKDNYSKNYRLLQNLFDKHAKENPMQIYEFIFATLNQAILLPISANDQDTALTIFSTLNDRGLSLSDADIFKSKLYNIADTTDAKKDFMDKWLELNEQAQNIGESIQQLFYYNMFYLRALDGDVKTTTPGLRKYYDDKNTKKLYRSDTLDNLFTITNLWKVLKNGEYIENEPWSDNIEIKKALDILSSYTNEFWKYPVIIYYLTYHNETDFEKNFLLFLNKLIVELLTKFLSNPTVNAVKPEILKLNTKIINTSKPEFDFKGLDAENLKGSLIVPYPRIERMLLKFITYQTQDKLLPKNWEIEHIFPQKYQTNYFPNEDDRYVKEKIQHIGNKIPLDKKSNIVAGNGYFLKKKTAYGNSEFIDFFEEAKNLADSDITDWNLESIENRDKEIVKIVFGAIEKARADYLNS